MGTGRLPELPIESHGRGIAWRESDDLKKGPGSIARPQVSPRNLFAPIERLNTADTRITSLRVDRNWRGFLGGRCEGHPVGAAIVDQP